MTGDNMAAHFVGPGGQLVFVNSGNTARIASMDNTGNLSVNGWLKPGNNSYIMWNDTNHRIQAGTQNVTQFFESGNSWQFVEGSGQYAFIRGDGASYIDFGAFGAGMRCWSSPNLTTFGNTLLVGGGVDAHGFLFYVAGTAGGLAGWNATSTERVKTGLTPISSALTWSVIDDPDLQGLHYLRTDRENRPEYGFSAERWVQVVPEAVSLDDHGDPAGMDYAMVIPFLFTALKDVHARLKALEAA
jgi:hypothetical protein